MPPTEADLLKRYLLAQSTLPEIVPAEQFASFFPPSQRMSKQVRALYLDLQRQRNAQIDAVTGNVEAEVTRSREVRREMREARRDAENEDIDEEIEIERALFDKGSNPQEKRHTLQSIVPELELAAADVEADIERLAKEEAALLESVRGVVGGMSDLRYGRLSNPQLRDEVLESLSSVQDACKQKTLD